DWVWSAQAMPARSSCTRRNGAEELHLIWAASLIRGSACILGAIRILHRKDQRLAATNENLIDVARRDDTLIVFPHTQRTGGKTFRDAAGGRGAVPLITPKMRKMVLEQSDQD